MELRDILEKSGLKNIVNIKSKLVMGKVRSC
jgi:hypothetical protein